MKKQPNPRHLLLENTYIPDRVLDDKQAQQRVLKGLMAESWETAYQQAWATFKNPVVDVSNKMNLASEIFCRHIDQAVDRQSLAEWAFKAAELFFDYFNEEVVTKAKRLADKGYYNPHKEPKAQEPEPYKTESVSSTQNRTVSIDPLPEAPESPETTPNEVQVDEAVPAKEGESDEQDPS